MRGLRCGLAGDPVEDLLKEAKAPWYVRLGWRMKKGAIMQAVLAFLDAKLGKGWKRMAWGVVFCLILITQSVAIIFGIQIPVLNQALVLVSSYLSAANPDAPVSLNEAPAQVGLVVTALVSGVGAFIALLQPFLRYWLDRKKA